MLYGIIYNTCNGKLMLRAPQFVANYTENNLDGERLASVYAKISKGQHGKEGAPPDRGGSAGLGSRADLGESDGWRRSEGGGSDLAWD